MTAPGVTLPVFGRRSAAVDASIREIDGRTISWFSLDGGKHRGAIGTAEGETIERAVHLAVELGLPIVGPHRQLGGRRRPTASPSLHAWGRVAKALTDASGVVPIVLLLVGPAVSGPALLLGIADHVIMTADAFAYVTGPEVVAAFTGVPDRRATGSAAPTVHERQSGVATCVVADEDDAMVALEGLLSYLPSNHLADPPCEDTDDPVDRPATRAAAAVPARATASYDVRTRHRRTCSTSTPSSSSATATRPSMVTGLGRLDGRAGRRGRQPAHAAGRQPRHRRRAEGGAVRSVVRLLQPPRRHLRRHAAATCRARTSSGAASSATVRSSLHAYAAATVPRICVVLRKAYGGAYIVMDSAGLGVDYCIAWPTAEIAVMGAPPAVQILHRRRLQAIDDPTERAEEQAKLVAEYEDRFLNPYIAAERGYVDIVIAAEDTRRVLVDALVAPRHQARAATRTPTFEHSPLVADRKVVVLQGKRILVTGVLNDASIAYSTARLAQEQGAEVILSSFGRVMRLTERTAKRLPDPDVQIVELDVTKEDDLAALGGERRRHARRCAALPRVRARVVPRGRLPRRTLGGRGRGAPGLGLLAEGARRRRPAADGPGRVDRGPRLRQRRRRLARLRLDGRVEGGVRVRGPVPGP